MQEVVVDSKNSKMSEKEKNSLENNKKYELVAPDGGWGYLICVGAIINYSTTMMFTGSFGMIFNDFLIELEMGSTSVTLLSGINSIFIAIAGYFTNSLLKVMSIRKLSFIAALLHNAGVFAIIFVKTKVMFFVSQALLQSIGFGLLYNISCTVINDYFLKKRLLAISITQTMAAVSAMVAPQIVKWSLEEYGFRGTLIVISAISTQTFISAALMQPVAWHMKKVEIPDTPIEETKLLVEEKNEKSTIPTTPTITLQEVESPDENKNGINSDNDSDKDEGKTSNRIRWILEELLKIKQFVLSPSAMGTTFSQFVETVYAFIFPQALYAWGWNKYEVAQAITLMSLGDLATRASFIFLNKWLVKIGSHEIYILGLIVAVISRLGMLWTENMPVMLIFMTIMGIARCVLGILPPLVYADSFRPEEFTSIIGISMMMYGIMNLTLGPTFGAIRDSTDSYVIVFYIATGGLAIFTLLWSIELGYKKNKQRKKQRKESKETEMKTLKS